MSGVFNNIRAELARNRYTIEQLAEFLGIERKTFYNWELKGDFPAKYVPAMAKFLNCSVDCLFDTVITDTESTSSSDT